MDFYFAILLLGFLGSSASGDNATHYTAGVVEYFPKVGENLSDKEVVLENVAVYENLIDSASSQGVDIIVFPEVGLTGVFTNKSVFYSDVPHPRESTCPCLQPDRWSASVVRISCAARSKRIYVAVNLYEKDGEKRYNTNVVFDRDGVVVSRYRKMHLFGENNLHVPEESEYSPFRTDFGVTFGQTICFDLLFEEPAHKLVKTQNIRHFVFSTAWFSEGPLLMSTQTQAAWSWSHDAVLLASGLNDPRKGCTGSGIYAGRRGAITTIFSGKETTELLIAAVPKDLSSDAKISTQSKFDNELSESILNGGLYLIQDHLYDFSTELLRVPSSNSKTYNRTLCHGEFCCIFEVLTNITDVRPDIEEEGASEDDAYCDVNVVGDSVSVPKSLNYRLFVWNGVRDCSGAATLGVQTCGVMVCKTPDDVTSCGWPIRQNQFSGQINFIKLRISGVFEGNNTMLLADTLGMDLRPLDAHLFALEQNGGQCVETTDQGLCVSLLLLQEQNQLQTFAIYNRVFERDGSDFTHLRRDVSKRK